MWEFKIWECKQGMTSRGELVNDTRAPLIEHALRTPTVENTRPSFPESLICQLRITARILRKLHANHGCCFHSSGPTGTFLLPVRNEAAIALI